MFVDVGHGDLAAAQAGRIVVEVGAAAATRSGLVRIGGFVSFLVAVRVVERARVFHRDALFAD